MKFILLNKYLVKELAANVQIGKVVRVARVNDLNRFAIIFKPPLGNLAKKYPDCATLLEPSNNYRLFLSTNSLDDVSKAVCNILGLVCGDIFNDPKANKILALYGELKANKDINEFIRKAQKMRLEDWIVVCMIHAFVNIK